MNDRFDAVKGSYRGGSDDVLGRWYIVDREGDYIDKRGRGFATRAEALATAKERVDRWLGDLFEYEYCEECGGDAQHHTVVPFMGNPFARCDYPPDADGNRHPFIAAFREGIVHA